MRPILLPAEWCVKNNGVSGRAINNHRRHLLEIYQSAVTAVEGRRTVREYLDRHVLRSPVYLAAVGKAAVSMTEGAREALGEAVASVLMITKKGHCADSRMPVGSFRCLESAHPVPDACSLAAGEELLRFIRTAPPEASLLFLISGGTSSLVEVLPRGVGVEQLAKLNGWLLGSGLSIHWVNRIRKTVSGIKGGRLAEYLDGRPATALVISDVPGDDLRSIGSGFLVEHAQKDLDVTGLYTPVWLKELAKNAPPLPNPGVFASIQHHIIASSAGARVAAERHGIELGYTVHGHEELLAGDAVAAGKKLAAQILDGPPGLQVWGGETTVHLPLKPGRGGRCQSLALAAAASFQGRGKLMLLAAGTDGGDGPGEDAGAIVDGDSLERGMLSGLQAAECLAKADAGSFLEASGDLIYTGPTGTNVMDLILGLKLS